MANSSAFFSLAHPPRFRAGIAFPSLLALLFLSFLAAASPAKAAVPEYLRVALTGFSPEAPKQWAYSLTTERDEQKSTERYDPSLPPTSQWNLLKTEDRAPTEKELNKYVQYKARHSPGAMQATFQKNDIEPGSIKLVTEDRERAEYTCTFREVAANGDKMLGHLQLRLFVNKNVPHVEKFILTLIEPYSPILGVKMNELVVTTEYSAPTADRPSLPSKSSSHFIGRIFFIPMTEDLRHTYFDFAPAAP